MQAMRLVLQSLDGRSEATRLTSALLADLGLSEPGELPFRVSGGFVSTAKLLEMQEGEECLGVMIDSGHILGKDINTYSDQEAGREEESFEAGLYFPRIERLEPLTRSEIAALCPQVVEVARQGDRVACQILYNAGEELGRLAAAVIMRLEMAGDEFAIVPFGGVFKAGELILHSFRQVCLAAAPHATVVLPKYEPEVGAVLLALHEIGIAVDGEVTGAIEASATCFPACIQ
jgi:hypothetical protein